MNTSPDRTPVSIITGFLGSGKTTLLNRLLQHPGMAGAAVIINEFGEIGLDHLLVTTPNENTVLLASGCICCTVRGDLVDTLRDLFSRRREGAIPAFDRVVIETTGLADPVPIIQTVVTDEKLAPCFRLDSVVTLVDGVNGMLQLDQHAESVKQIAVADRMLITKADLAAPAVIGALRERLGNINPGAQTFLATRGEIAPESLFGAALHRVDTDGRDVARWLGEAAYAGSPPSRDHVYRVHDGNRHDNHIRAFCIYLDQPLSSAGLTAWLTALASLRGANLLRMKGLLNVEDRPVAVHAVQTLIHEPLALARWPDADRRSRLVFITRDMAREHIEATLDVLRWQETPARPRQTLDPQTYAKFVAAMEKFH
ncbi:MAG TPA: GTP-binding protein [Burkholderiales bacterium]|nr:GTP-binding protein [Burkholderiales bacterium]